MADRTPEETSLTVEAAARAKALAFGILPLEALIAWADGRIQAEPDFDPRLIDLSLAKSDAEARAALYAFGPATDKPRIAARLFPLLREALASGGDDGRKVAKALYHMAMDGYVPAPELEGPMWCFWDDLDLAIDGIHGDPEEVRGRLSAYLAEATA